MIELSHTQSRVYNVMFDKQWRTLEEIGDAVGLTASSAGSRLRDLKLTRYGNQVVNRRSKGNGFEYQLVTQLGTEVEFKEGWEDFKAAPKAEPSPFRYIQADLIDSDENPRELRRNQALDELGANIKSEGIIEPLIVRPKDEDRFGLVIGQRRFAAGTEFAGPDAVPCIVRSLTDQEAFLLQLSENDHREDLTPMEQARGYRKLIEEFGYTMQQVNHRTGKSMEFIRLRLKLTDLPESAMAALQEGVISLRIARLIAGIGVPEFREEAAAAILGLDHPDPRPGEFPFDFETAKRYVIGTFTTNLEGAPFPIGDEELVPEAGSCHKCPFRSGVQPSLFQDMGGDDICMKTTCFQQKADAHFEHLKSGVDHKGRILTRYERIADEAEEVKEIFPYGETIQQGDFLSIDQINHNDEQSRTYRVLLGDDCPDLTLVRMGNRLIEAVRRKDATRILAGKYDWAGADGPAAPSKDKKERLERKRFFKELSGRMLEEALQASSKDSIKSLRFLCLASSRAADSGDVRKACARREIEAGEGESLLGRLTERIPQMKTRQLLELLVELVISPQSKGECSPLFMEQCLMFGVDAAVVKEAVATDLQMGIPDEVRE